MQQTTSSGRIPAWDVFAAALGILALLAALRVDLSLKGAGPEALSSPTGVPGGPDSGLGEPRSALQEAGANLKAVREHLDLAGRLRNTKSGGQPVLRSRIAEQCRMAILAEEGDRRAAYISTTTGQQVAAAAGYATRIRTVCGLNEEQGQQVLLILQDQVRAYGSVLLGESVDLAAIRKIDDDTEAKILALLTPGQAANWPKARRSWLQSWANRTGDR